MSSSTPGRGDILAGRYRIEQLLGQGGMGSVYRGVQLSLGRPVAIKRLVDERSTSAAQVERFEREALALGRLSHPSTVRLYDFGWDERRRPFLVMELLEGCDFAADLARSGPLRWERALSVIQQVLGSLSEAHAAGVVHRDLKPANLFSCAGGAWPRVKVLDFGIAGGADSSCSSRRLTQTGAIVGSAAYMAPEQARGEAVGPAADLYAVGAVLFELITGRTPFQAPGLTAQLLAKVLEPAPELQLACPEAEVPPELSAIVAQLLERDPGRRPSSAAWVAERLGGLLGGASMPSSPSSPASPNLPTPSPAKTEPMAVPPTLMRGWALPTFAEWAAGKPRQLRRTRGAIAAPVAVAAVAGLVWALAVHGGEPASGASGSAEPSAPLPAGALAPHAGAVASALQHQKREPSDVDPGELESGERDPGDLEPGALEPEVPPPAPGMGALARHEPGEARASVSQATASEADRHRVVSRPEASELEAQPASSDTEASRLAAAPASSSPAVTRAPTAEPSGGASLSSSPAPGSLGAPRAGEAHRAEPPAPGLPALRYPSIAAAEAAERAGNITPLQRNDTIAALLRWRLSARARAAREYREGRIDRAELEARQRSIERAVEGRRHRRPAQ